MRRHRRWFFGAALATLVLDQTSKSLVRAWLPLGLSVPVVPNAFHITHTQNPGAAFGLFPNATMLLIVIALSISAILLWLGRQGFDSKQVAAAAGMMLGGALGNLVDRIRFGAVTDFIDLRVWPIFNIADAALTMGALFLFWWSISSPTEALSDEPKGGQKERKETVESEVKEFGEAG